MDLYERLENLNKKNISDDLNNRLHEIGGNFEDIISKPSFEENKKKRNIERIQKVKNETSRFDRINSLHTYNLELSKKQEEAKKQLEDSFKKTYKISQNPLSTANNNNYNNQYKNIITGIAQNTDNIKPMSRTEMAKYGVDTRSGLQKRIDDISAIGGNIAMGVESVIPSTAKYLDSLGEYALQKGGEKILGNLTNNEMLNSGLSIIGSNLGNRIWSTTDIAKANKGLNSEKMENWRSEIINSNLAKTTNGFTKKIAEIAPSIGNNALPMAASAVNPILGTTLFMTSAAGNYLSEAKERGMKNGEDIAYATIMGSIEGLSEKLITGSMLSKFKNIATGTPITSKVLNSFGMNIGENFVQESIIEPLSEITATITGGRETANWDNMLNRTLQAGIDGVLSSILLIGAGTGVSSAVKVVNKIDNNITVSESEVRAAVEDIQNSGNIDIKEIIKKSINEVKNTYNNAKVEVKQFGNELKTFKDDIKNTQMLPTAKTQNIVENNTMPTSATQNKTEIAPNELMRGINKRTKNNLELNLDTLPTARAKIENNRITLDRETGRLEDVIHEATHYSESNSKGYETLKNHVLTELKKDENFEEIRNNINELYSQQYQSEGRTFTEQDLEKELVAKYTERFITDESFVNKMTKADRNLAQKIYDWIKDKVNYYKKIVKMEPEQIAEYDNLRKAEKLWEKVLKGVGNNNKNIKNTKYHIEPVAKFDEIEYNNINQKKLGKREYAILKNIINSDSNIKPGINYVHVTNGRYTIYYKGFDDFKVMSKETDEGAGRINERNDTTRGKTRYSGAFEQNIEDQRATTSNDEVSNFNTRGNGERGRSNTSGSENIGNEELDNTSSFSMDEIKEKQLEIIKKVNPANDDYHTWIRNIDDIKTFEETLQDSDWQGYDEFNPDYTLEMAQEAIKNGKITVYSSYPIKQGVFVSPSYMEAESYSGNGKVYEKTVKLTDVAWIDPTQGQYAKIDDIRKTQTLPTSKDNQAPRYSIAGKKGMENAIKYDSNNIELERMYNRAKALQMNGVDNETIRKQTSWFQDKNGDWKFEFTDKQMSLKNNIKLKANTSYKLDDILQHNTLFMVYPELKNYDVKINEMDANGSFNAKSKTIKLNNSLLKNQKSIEGTLIHEIQHAIQYIEGFETGRRANKSKLAYLNSLGEIEATDTKNRLYAEKYNHKNMNNIAPESSKTNPQHAKLDTYLKNRGIIDKIKDSVYNYFETKNKNGDESYDYTQNKNDKGQIDNKNSEDVLQARRKDVGEIWNRWWSEEGRRISNQELDNSSSFSTDNKGRELTREQQEYFKDSKVRDENGNLLEVYHGTEANVGIPKEHWFTIFDIDRAGNHGNMLGDGFYFTSNKSHAEQYAHTKGNIYTAYLNITNPLELNNFSTGELVYAIRKINPLIEADIYKRNGTIDGYKVRRYLLNNGYDGVHSGNTYVAFNSNQIKNIDNLNPTDSLDIRYSLNNEEKKKYAKYKNDNTDYKNDMIDKALEIVKPNSQGRRTKEQWLNVADYIGKELDGLSEAEVEKIAYRSWFDLAPNQKEQLNRQGKNYVSFGVNEWVNKVTESYKKIRTVKDNGTTYTLDKFYNENINNFNNIEEAEKTFEEFYNIQLKNKQNSNVAEKAIRKKSVAMKADDTQAPKNIRQFYDNVQTSGAIEKDLKKLVNPKEYRKISNDETMNKAIIKLSEDSAEATKWLGRVTRDDYKPSSIDVAEGLVLLAKYQHEKQYEQANDVVDRLAEIGTKGGQAIQMYSLLQRLTPEGMVVYATRSLKKAFDMDSQNKNQKWIDEHKDEYKLTADDQNFIKERMDKVATMENGRDKEILLAEIQKRMMEKLPPEKGSGIKAYMRISMLFNPKTQIRNILGNAVIAPVNMVSDTFGSFADKLVAKKTGIRTKGMTNVQSVIKGTSTGIYKSFDDFKRGINTRNLAGDRFELGKNERPSFSNKNRFGRAMNSLDRTLSFMLDLGDRPFYESAFLNSINNQMELNNVPKPTAEMIEIATTEALQRTWQDNNAYSAAVMNLRDIFNGKIDFDKYGIHIHTKGFRYGLGDVLIPFAKTPANLTKAIVDYSPAGFIKTLFKNSKELNNAISRNDKDVAKYQHKFVDNLGKGMAGSLLYILGWALAKAGIATGDGDEDKDVANFMKNTLGIQPYSIKIGDKSFTYDWAQPIAIPVAIMSNYVKYSENNPEATAITKAIKASIIGSEQLFEQSFMSSISNVINGYNESYLENIFDEILALPARAVPTFWKQIADMVDSTQRTSFDKSDKLATAKNKVIAKLPIASKTLAPAVDTFGREIKKYGGDNNFFNVFLNPANTNKGQYTESAKEVYDLYKKTGDKTVFPRQAPYSVTNGDETIQMDSKTRTEYQKTAGKYADNSINQLIKSSDYKKLTNEEKIKILNSVFDDGTEIAKEINLGIERKLTDANKALTKGLSLSNMYIYENIINQIESDKDSEGETIRGSKNANMAEYITSMKTYETDKDIMLGLISDSRIKPTMKDLKVIGIENYAQYFSINADKREEYVTLVKTGMNTSTLNKYLTEIGNIEGEKDKNGKTISGSKKSAIVNYINSLNGLTYNEKLILYAKQGYSMTTSERSKIFNYINSLKLTSDEKINLLKSMGSNYTINNDGKVYWD